MSESVRPTESSHRHAGGTETIHRHAGGTETIHRHAGGTEAYNVCTCGASLIGLPTWVTTHCPSCGKEVVRRVGRRRGPKKLEKVTKKDFTDKVEHMVTTPDGQVMTKSEFRKYWAEVKRQSRDCEFDLYAADIGAERLEDFDYGEPLTTDKMFICGCEKSASFSTNLPGLKSLCETAKKLGKTVHCPRCGSHEVDDRMRDQIAERGGALAENVNGKLFAAKWYKVRCSNGHVFKVNGATLDRGSWCAECYAQARALNADRLAAERGAEFGLDLVQRADSPNVHLYADGSGVAIETRASYLLTQSPILGPAPFTATVYHKDGQGFLIIGAVPLLLPEPVARLVRDGTATHVETFTTKKVANAARAHLLTDLSTRYDMLNVVHNPQWITPGKYKWGTISPLSDGLVYVNAK
jgi:predicted RNA-binding Zn-ribbon protein involved in translation (DUF1610 family)